MSTEAHHLRYKTDKNFVFRFPAEEERVSLISPVSINDDGHWVRSPATKSITRTIDRYGEPNFAGVCVSVLLLYKGTISGSGSALHFSNRF